MSTPFFEMMLSANTRKKVKKNDVETQQVEVPEQSPIIFMQDEAILAEVEPDLVVVPVPVVKHRKPRKSTKKEKKDIVVEHIIIPAVPDDNVIIENEVPVTDNDLPAPVPTTAPVPNDLIEPIFIENEEKPEILEVTTTTNGPKTRKRRKKVLENGEEITVKLKDWSIHYAALLEYCKEHGTGVVPRRNSYICTLTGMGESGGDYHYEGNLGGWLNNQRTAKRGTGAGKLTPAREALLQILVDDGKMQWDNSSDTCVEMSRKRAEKDWPRHYAALFEYYKEKGTCNVPARITYECNLVGMGENGTDFHYVGNLGTWLRYQRQARKEIGIKKLTSEREALLQLLVDEGKMQWETPKVSASAPSPPTATTAVSTTTTTNNNNSTTPTDISTTTSTTEANK